MDPEVTAPVRKVNSHGGTTVTLQWNTAEYRNGFTASRSTANFGGRVPFSLRTVIDVQKTHGRYFDGS